MYGGRACLAGFDQFRQKRRAFVSLLARIQWLREPNIEELASLWLELCSGLQQLGNVEPCKLNVLKTSICI